MGTEVWQQCLAMDGDCYGVGDVSGLRSQSGRCAACSCRWFRWVLGGGGAVKAGGRADNTGLCSLPDHRPVRQTRRGTPSTTTLSMLNSMCRRETTCLVGVYGSGFWVW